MFLRSGHFRSERKLSSVNFRKDFRDRYEGRSRMLLAHIFPVPSNSPRFPCETNSAWPPSGEWAKTLNCLLQGQRQLTVIIKHFQIVPGEIRSFSQKSKPVHISFVMYLGDVISIA